MIKSLVSRQVNSMLSLNFKVGNIFSFNIKHILHIFDHTLREYLLEEHNDLLEWHFVLFENLFCDLVSSFDTETVETFFLLQLLILFTRKTLPILVKKEIT